MSVAPSRLLLHWYGDVLPHLLDACRDIYHIYATQQRNHFSPRGVNVIFYVIFSAPDYTHELVNFYTASEYTKQV